MASQAPCAACWKDLVGKDADDAKKKILETHKNLDVVIVPQGSLVTGDFKEDRVRLYADDKNKVVSIPARG